MKEQKYEEFDYQYFHQEFYKFVKTQQKFSAPSVFGSILKEVQWMVEQLCTNEKNKNEFYNTLGFKLIEESDEKNEKD